MGAKPKQVPVACQNHFPDEYEVFTIEPSFNRNSELEIKILLSDLHMNFKQNVNRHKLSLL
jgi:hypothetical protein